MTNCSRGLSESCCCHHVLNSPLHPSFCAQFRFLRSTGTDRTRLREPRLTSSNSRMHFSTRSANRTNGDRLQLWMAYAPNAALLLKTFTVEPTYIQPLSLALQACAVKFIDGLSSDATWGRKLRMFDDIAAPMSKTQGLRCDIPRAVCACALAKP